MANTYHQIYLQTVFAVKYREALIQEEWKSELCAVIGNLIQDAGCKTLIVNGTKDHVHCFLGQKPAISVSEIMQSVKAKSSKWVNESGKLAHKFNWQAGYGCFSYSHLPVDHVYRYIENQEQHHKKMSFREEKNPQVETCGYNIGHA